MPETASEPYPMHEEGITVYLDPECDEEFYRSDLPVERAHFKLNLDGYEMRALRTLLGKVR